MLKLLHSIDVWYRPCVQVKIQCVVNTYMGYESLSKDIILIQVHW